MAGIGRKRWVGRALTALAVLFLVFDAAMKLARAAPSIQATVGLGFPAGAVFGIGAAEAVCLVLYLVPRTSVLGAVALTGYLGGAVAANLRLENPLFTHTLFPVYFALVVWAGVWLRVESLRALVPLRAEVRR